MVGMSITRLSTTNSYGACFPLAAHWSGWSSCVHPPPPKEQELREPLKHRGAEGNGTCVPPRLRVPRCFGEQHGDALEHLRGYAPFVEEVIEHVQESGIPTRTVPAVASTGARA